MQIPDPPNIVIPMGKPNAFDDIDLPWQLKSAAIFLEIVTAYWFIWIPLWMIFQMWLHDKFKPERFNRTKSVPSEPKPTARRFRRTKRTKLPKAPPVLPPEFPSGE